MATGLLLPDVSGERGELGVFPQEVAGETLASQILPSDLPSQSMAHSREPLVRCCPCSWFRGNHLRGLSHVLAPFTSGGQRQVRTSLSPCTLAPNTAVGNIIRNAAQRSLGLSPHSPKTEELRTMCPCAKIHRLLSRWLAFSQNEKNSPRGES